MIKSAKRNVGTDVGMMIASSTSGKTMGLLQYGTDYAVGEGRRVGRSLPVGCHQPSVCGSLHRTVQITSADAVKREGVSSQGWFVESVHIPVGEKMEVRFQGPVHLLAMCEEGARRNGETSIEGFSGSTRRKLTGKLTFVPAGYRYREELETVAPTRITFLYLDPIRFRGDREADVSPRIHFEDSVVWETAAKLKGAIENGRVERSSYLAALSSVLALELSRSDHNAMEKTPPNRGGLASWQERVVIDYIEEHVGEQVCLRTLARLVRLSEHHFCRAFSGSFGVPPHQYHIKRRVERAKLLLLDRAISVTAIGLTVGYSQASSFTTVFRKVTGWTPSEYRKRFKRDHMFRLD